MVFPFTEDTVTNFLQNDISQRNIDDIVSDIKAKNQHVTEFVTILKPALCAKENDTRMLGTNFLVNVLEGLNSNDLNEAEVQIFWNFFGDRLNDHHSIIPFVLSGCLILCKNYSIPANAFSEFLTKMFRCIVCQTQRQEDRKKIFEILKIASESIEEDLKIMGVDWIYGVINAIEGERDPRNLLLIFQFMPQLIRNYSLYHLSEEAFEVFAVYFPIDFTQSDPSGITRDTLAKHLAECLCSSPDFFEGSVALVEEKMSSDIETAKKDSLKLLIKLSEIASTIQLSKHFKSIWNCIKGEILTRQNSYVKNLSLDAIKCIMTNLGQEDQTCNNAVDLVLVETMSAISDIESNLFDQSFDIICSCISSSHKVALLIVSNVLPILMSLHKKVSGDQKLDILKCVERICTILDNLNIVTKLKKEDLDLVLNQVMHILMNETDPNILEIAVQITQKINKAIPEENRQIIYSKFIYMAGDSKYYKILPCISGSIASFGLQYPDEIFQLVFENLKLSVTTHNTSQPLKLLIHLMFVQKIKEDLSSYIMQCILSEALDNIQLETLTYLVEVLTKNEEILIENKIFDIETLICFMQKHQEMSSDFLKSYSILLDLSIKKSDEEVQKQIILKFLSQLKPERTSDLYILSGLLGHIKMDKYMYDHFEELSQNLIKLSTTSSDSESRMICNHILCSLFNKVPDDMEKKITKNTLEILDCSIKSQLGGSLETFAWISKGLLVRGSSDYGTIIDMLVDLLNDTLKAHIAVMVFEIICQDCSQVHLPNIKHLYKQKLWSYVIRKFEYHINELSEEHIMVLIRIITILPLTVVKNDISKVGHILIKAIGLKNNQYVLECLSILNKLTECHDFFATYATTIILKLLNLAQFSPLMNIRIAALECLYNLTDLPLYILVPLKDDVTYGIIPILDDNKRLVRNAAAKTRLKWCLIGESEDV